MAMNQYVIKYNLDVEVRFDIIAITKTTSRNTFESIGKPLPNRKSIIITRNTLYQKEGCKIVHSLEEAITSLKNQEDAFIIGGAQIYKEALEKNLVDALDITEVHQDFDADVFFPSINKTDWKEVSREKFFSEDNNPNYSFISYRRIN